MAVQDKLIARIYSDKDFQEGLFASAEPEKIKTYLQEKGFSGIAQDKEFVNSLATIAGNPDNRAQLVKAAESFTKMKQEINWGAAT